MGDPFPLSDSWAVCPGRLGGSVRQYLPWAQVATQGPGTRHCLWLLAHWGARFSLPLPLLCSLFLSNKPLLKKKGCFVENEIDSFASQR